MTLRQFKHKSKIKQDIFILFYYQNFIYKAKVKLFFELYKNEKLIYKKYTIFNINWSYVCQSQKSILQICVVRWEHHF